MCFGSKLYILTQIYTLLVLALFIADFLSQGTRPVPNNHVVVYLALLSAYAADKEVARWAARKQKTEPPAERKGSWVVALWALGYAGLAVWCTVYPEWKMPLGLDRAVIMIIGVFFGSAISKRFCGMLSPTDGAWGQVELDARAKVAKVAQAAEALQNEQGLEREAVLAALKGAGKAGLSSGRIASVAGLSRRTIQRHLAQMKAQGLVKSGGNGPRLVYILTGKA
jgi:predicted transcriptional regulator